MRVGAMGDVLHGLPAVASLRAALPDSFLGWAVEDHLEPLLHDSSGNRPLVDRVHSLRTHAWRRTPLAPETLKEILALRTEMLDEDYDLCIDLQGTVKSSVFGRMAEPGSMIGPDQPKEWPARLLYQQRVQHADPHVIQQASEIISAAVGLPIAAAPIALPSDAAAEAWVDDLKVGSGFALLSPTAGWGGKEWGVERFAALAVELENRGIHVLINAVAGANQDAASQIAASAGRVIPSTLAQMIALIRRAGVVIGGDSGPVHMAAALGRPVVMLFGATDPLRNGPYFVDAKFIVIRHPSSVNDYRHHQITDEGLKQIPVEQVLEAALTMLATS
jgi:heptosyltransferase-1